MLRPENEVYGFPDNPNGQYRRVDSSPLLPSAAMKNALAREPSPESLEENSIPVGFKKELNNLMYPDPHLTDPDVEWGEFGGLDELRDEQIAARERLDLGLQLSVGRVSVLGDETDKFEVVSTDFDGKRTTELINIDGEAIE